MKSSRGCLLTVLTLLWSLAAQHVIAQSPGLPAGGATQPSGLPMGEFPRQPGGPATDSGLIPGLGLTGGPVSGTPVQGLGAGPIPAVRRGVPVPFAAVSGPGGAPVIQPPRMAAPVAYGQPAAYAGAGYPLAGPPGAMPAGGVPMNPAWSLPPGYGMQPGGFGGPVGYADAGVGYGAVPASLLTSAGPMGPPGSVLPADGTMMGPPPGLMPPTMSAGEYGSPMMGEGVCPECYGTGCDFCAGFGRGVLAGVLSHLLPYGEGGCCEPRYFDISMDVMYLRRDNISRRVNFTSLGPGPNPDIVLSTDDLDFEDQAGFRFTGAYQIFAGSNLEFTYFGLFNWADSASVSDPAGGLFSSLTGFGTFPPGGFPQTDNSVFQSIAYSSSIDNFELNVRKRFTAPNCRVQASWLAGVRYVYLLEDFDYETRGQNLNRDGEMDYSIRARNSLTGFQIGGDLWTCVVPGIKVGGELKAGVFGNYANAKSEIVATQPDAVFREDNDINDVAFVGDASLSAIWRVNPNWTIRFGYNFLYIDGVALAPEQYNDSAPPNVISPFLRAVRTSDDGFVFYHGANVGFEWMW